MLKYYVAAQVGMSQLKKSKKGQSLAEYGLILGLIAVVCIAALTAMGGQIRTMLTNITTALNIPAGG